MFPYGESNAVVRCGFTRLLGFAAGWVLVVVVMAGSAWANMTITAPGIDMVGMCCYAGDILTALAGIWLLRKFAKTTNRS